MMEKIKNLILKTAKKFKVEPHDVSSSQFWSTNESVKKNQKVTEWQVRKLGGFTNLRDTLYPNSEANNEVMPRSNKKKKFRLVNKKLDNFTVHDVNLSEVWKLAKLKDNDVLRLVVQPDTHVPEEDKVAINAFCKFLEYYKPHGLINLGDFMEMGPVSHWEGKDSKVRRFVPEAKEGRQLLKRIGEASGPQCVLKRYIMGNHEDWLQQYLNAKIPELVDNLEDLGLDLNVQNLLGLKDLGYRVVPLNEILRVGNAHFIHGYYTGVHHAKKHLDVFGCNIYYGHLHDVQGYSGVSVNGIHESMSLGCLRTLQAPFLKGKPNNWSHSFGIFEFRKDGSYTRYVPIIVDGKFTFNGILYDGNV